MIIDQEKLKIILKKHELWLESNAESGKRINLTGERLENLNFKNALLIQSIFDKTKIVSANFRYTYLRNAQFNNAEIVKSIFTESDLQAISFNRATLDTIDFSGSKLWLSDFERTFLTNVSFENTDLQESNFKNSKIATSNFRRTILIKADFENAVIVESQFPFIIIDKRTADSLPTDIQDRYRHTWDIRDSNGNPLLNQQIVSSFDLPPQYHQIGMMILTHLGKVLHDKYSDKVFKFRLEQDNIKVTMIIETNENDKELIENTIRDYGLVISNKMLPEAFSSDESQLEEMNRILQQISEYQRHTQEELLRRINRLEETHTIAILPKQVQLIGKTISSSSSFMINHSIIIKPGPLRKGLLYVNSKPIPISSVESDICIALASQSIRDWGDFEDINSIDVGWVSYDSLRTSVSKWYGRVLNAEKLPTSKSRKEIIEDITIIKAVNRINKKIRDQLNLQTREEDLIENGNKYGRTGQYRFKIHPQLIQIED